MSEAIDLRDATVLIVDDFPTNLAVLRGALEPKGYEILAAKSGEAALKIAREVLPDLILLDVIMPGLNGFEVCRRLKADEATADIPIIFITAKDEVESVVEGFEAGGADYMVKPFHNEEVMVRVETQLKVSWLLRALTDKNHELEEAMTRGDTLSEERDHLADQLTRISSQEARRWGVEGFVGGSSTLQKILGDIGRLQQVGATSVLIVGESGTGKELVARAIHFGSLRAPGAFVPVNCSAIPGELAESLFFGHKRGSFTGADRDRSGYFELADEGTIFLDEIGDMPLDLQAKLLRVLEDGKVLPVGADREKSVDVRVLAATNADMQARIEAGTFREDLYFRLARFLVEVPPLRMRSEDIPLLAEHFLEMFAVEMGRSKSTISAEALAALKDYRFPGNVRELKNIIERGLIESGGAMIRPDHLHLRPARNQVAAPAQLREDVAEDLPLNLDAAELAVVNRALMQVGGNISKAAQLLGVERTKVYRILAKGERVQVEAGG